MKNNKQNLYIKDNRNNNISVLQEASSLAQYVLKSGLSSIIIMDNYYTLISKTKSMNIPVQHDIKGLWLSDDVIKDHTAGNATKLGSFKIQSLGFAVVLSTNEKVRDLVAKDLYNKGIPVLAIVNDDNVIPKQIKYALSVSNTLSLSFIDGLYKFFHQTLLGEQTPYNEVASFLESEAITKNNNEVLNIIRARQSKQTKSGWFQPTDSHYKFYRDVIPSKMKDKWTFNFPIWKRRKPAKP